MVKTKLITDPNHPIFREGLRFQPVGVDNWPDIKKTAPKKKKRTGGAWTLEHEDGTLEEFDE